MSPHAAEFGRTVLLRHELPDGSWHFDWLLEHTDHPDPLLAAFRVWVPVHSTGAFEAQRMQDHRALYLEYEGPLSQGRGSVVRVQTGACKILVDAPRAFIAEAAFGDGPLLRYEGEATGALGDGMAGDMVDMVESTWRFFSRGIP